MGYSSRFYENNITGSQRSAQVLIPIAQEILSPESYLDVGCGTGTWLATARDAGISDIFGVDGAWAEGSLVIPPEVFRAHDLSTPFDLNRRFDVAASLEVAEHVNENSADVFVDNLIRHADAVFFGAAIPHQGGTHHVNEQWAQYWIDKFATRGYRCFDVIRWRVWNDQAVEPWYRQNTFVYVRETRSDLIEKLAALEASHSMASIPVVHPALWVTAMTHNDGRTAVTADIRLIWHALGRILRNTPRQIMRRLRG